MSESDRAEKSLLPDRHFRHFRAPNLPISKVDVLWKHRSTDFEALKLQKSRSGVHHPSKKHNFDQLSILSFFFPLLFSLFLHQSLLNAFYAMEALGLLSFFYLSIFPSIFLQLQKTNPCHSIGSLPNISQLQSLEIRRWTN